MDNRPLAILDSGLGGLTIARAIWSRLAYQSTIYLADHQFFPYGDKTALQINRRLIPLMNFLVKSNCKAIVIACNTITATSIKLLRQLYRLPIIGTEPAIKPAIKANLKENIAVWVTHQTAVSPHFKTMIRNLDQRGQIQIVDCAGLADAIEALAQNQSKLKSVLKKYLAKIKINYSALVLGSTHYILVKDLIQQLVPSGVIVIEPSQAIAQQTETILQQFHLLPASTGPVKRLFFTTADHDQASSTASTLLGSSIIFTPCTL